MLKTVKNNENGSGTEITGNSKVAEQVTDTEILTDEDTAELRKLDLADFTDGEHTAAGSTDNASLRRAATSVMDVRGEVERLQKRWESLDEKLTEANHRAASLQAEVEEKDAKLATLVADLHTMQQQSIALEAATAERDATIASLELALTDRGEEVIAVSQLIAETNSRAGVFEDRLEAAKQEVEELRRSVQDAKSSEATLSAEKDIVFASQASLRTKLQSLESYVDGRREKWIERQAILTSQKSEISSLEAALASSESRFEERDNTIESLQTRINKLERESGELEGRHREHGATHQEAQDLLHERISEIEQLKAKLELANSSDGKAELDTLTASLAKKDDSIRGLEVDLGKFEAVKTHIEERHQTDRTTINELQQELAQLQAQRDQLTESLDDDRAQTRVLGEKLDAAEQASSALLDESTAQKERISALETELELRMEIIASFDANAEQLNQLNRSMNAESNEHTETKLDISDRDLERVRHGKHAMDDDGLYDSTAESQCHAMVALSDTSRTVYAISKPVTTIGRSKSSDIWIKDAVISRRHAHLQMDDEGLTIEDHGSKNGVLVNQGKVERAILKHGDIVSLGNHDLRYVVEQRRNTH